VTSIENIHPYRPIKDNNIPDSVSESLIGAGADKDDAPLLPFLLGFGIFSVSMDFLPRSTFKKILLPLKL
jgi:hypothetical protein